MLSFKNDKEPMSVIGELKDSKNPKSACIESEFDPSLPFKIPMKVFTEEALNMLSFCTER